MSVFELPGSSPSNKPKLYTDPFAKNNFEGAVLWIRKGILSDDFKFEADVTFKRGATTGKHEIVGKDFPDLVEKLNAFMNSLD